MADLDWILQGFNVYVDGFGKIGKAEEVTPPKIEKVMEAFRGGGTLGERDHAVGYKKMELKFKLNSFDPQTLRQCGLFSGKSLPISLTSAFDGDRNQRHTAQYICRGQFATLDPGTWSAGKKAMLDVTGTLDACRLIMDGQTIFDFDFEHQKYIANGVDEFGWIAAAL